MKKQINAEKAFPEELSQLRRRLAESEEILEAIREGSVDALMISDPAGDRVYTLKGADYNYRVLIETINEGALILDEDGTILYCNGRFSEMAKTPIENVMSRKVTDFIDSDEKDRFEALFNRAFAENIREELTVRQQDGNRLPVLLSMRSMITDEARSLCTIVSDLSVQKQHAEALHEKNIELERRARQLSRLSSELTLAEQQERDRIAEILHDHLQQLIVGAKIGQETLVSNVENGLKPIAERVLDLVNQSLSTSRSLSTELSPSVLKSNNFSMSLGWLARWVRENQGLDVDLHIEDDIVLDRKDLTILLFQSTRELLLNVLKHAEVHSASIATIYENGELRIAVSDAGRGFDPERMGKKIGSGKKFGLFSINERLLHLGGRLEIDSSPGSGSTIAMVVPLERATHEKKLPEWPRTFQEAPPAVPPDSEKIKVLLVDDHPVMRQGLSGMLGLQPDITIIGEASDGKEAVDVTRERLPDVVLMDVNMPMMNGIEATHIIHSMFPHIRIIGLSMYDEDEKSMDMLAAGASAYRSKSGNTDRLLAAIRGEND
ncbi:MAG: response regulator [Desulfobacterales bacterium]